MRSSTRRQLTRIALGFTVALGLWVLLGRSKERERTVGEPELYAPSSRSYTTRLVAVGDLHGDIDNTRQVLRMASVIDDSNTWSGGETTLVIIGDIADRGSHALDIYKLLSALRDEARAAGGRVITILGNHEMMNALGNWKEVPPGDIQAFGGLGARRHAMSTDGWLGAEWLAHWNISAKVPLGAFDGAPALSFTHASLRPTFPHLTPYPDAMNALGKSALARVLAAPPPPSPPSPPKEFLEEMTLDERSVLGARGPLWSRALAEGREKTVCRWASELKEILGVRRLISGHTPRLDKIVHRCGGAVINIDTGISASFGGVLSALEVHYTVTPEDDDGKTKALTPEEIDAGLQSGQTFFEREAVYAVYENRRVEIVVEEGLLRR